MNRIFRYAFWKLKGGKSCSGRKSGTGKSFRSKLVAEKHNIELIIDEGLLIRGTGSSRAGPPSGSKNFLTAVRTALFDEDDHSARP